MVPSLRLRDRVRPWHLLDLAAFLFGAGGSLERTLSVGRTLSPAGVAAITPFDAVVAVAGGLLAILLAVYTTLELIGFTAVQEFSALSSAFGALVSGNLTLITVVLSINQLVLSQALGGIGGLESNVENVSDYRERIRRETAKEVAPEEPDAFLELLLNSIRSEANRLRQATASEPGDLRDDVETVTERLVDHVDHVLELLDRPNTGVFSALASTLSTNYARELNALRRIEVRYEGELPSDATDALEDVTRRIKDVDIVRQYFKTMYIQEELSRLSRALLYVGVPSVLSGLGLLQMFVATDAGAFDPILLSVFVPVFVTIGAAPLAVLFAFVLRLSTVAERTVAVTPFTTPTQEHQPELKPAIDDAYAGED